MAANATPEPFQFQELVLNGNTVKRGVAFTIDVANPAGKTCTDLLTDAFAALRSKNSTGELDKYTFQYLNKNIEADEQATTTVKKLMDDAGVVSIDYKVPVDFPAHDKKDFAAIYNTAETVWCWNADAIKRLKRKEEQKFGYAQMKDNAETRLKLRTRYYLCQTINVVHVNSSDNEAVYTVVLNSNYLGEPGPENPYVYLQDKDKYGDDARKVYTFINGLGEKSRIEVADKDTVGNILAILEMIQSKVDKMIVKLYQPGQRSAADEKAIFTTLFKNPKAEIMYSTSLASDQQKRHAVANFLRVQQAEAAAAKKRSEDAAKAPKKARAKSKFPTVDTSAVPAGGGGGGGKAGGGGGGKAGGGGGGKAGPEYDRFFRMLKMGVPKHAVALQCQLAGLDPALLDGDGGGPSPPEPSPPVAVAVDHPSAILPADLSKMLEDALKRAPLQMDKAVLDTLNEVRTELNEVRAKLVAPVASPSTDGAAELQMNQAVLDTLEEVRNEQAAQATALDEVRAKLVAPVASPSTDGAAELKTRLDELKTELASLQKQQHETTSVDEILHALNYADEEHLYGKHVFTRGNIKKVRADIEENRQKVRATFDKLYEQYVHEKIEWHNQSDQVLARCRDVEHERDAAKEREETVTANFGTLNDHCRTLTVDFNRKLAEQNAHVRTLQRDAAITAAREQTENAIMAYRISCLGDDFGEKQRTHDAAQKCIDALRALVSQP